MRRRAKLIVLGIATLVAAYAVVWVCGIAVNIVDVLANGPLCTETSLTTTQAINNSAHIELPSSARSAQGLFTGKNHCLTYVRFEMDAIDYGPFMATTRIKVPLSAIAKPADFLTPPAKLGWKIESVTTNLAGVSIESLDYNQRIVVDTSNPDRYAVYLLTIHWD